eukprot:m.437937 g.437937  ORF g.437937 m.437937 type:complete len:160 (-) comp20273_c1_seq54:66-545(-)
MFRPLFQYYFDYVTTQVAVATHAGLRAGMAVAWRSVAVRLFPQQLPRRFLTTSQLRLCSEQPLLPETTVASTEPMEVDVVANKRFSWCTCGLSKKQPFCDGAHKRAGVSLKPLRVVPEVSESVWLCCCKQTSTPPYCDGSHNKLCLSAGCQKGPQIHTQ